MNPLSLLHQGLLVVQVIVCALMLAAAWSDEWRLLTTRRIDASDAAHGARAVAIGLSMLWFTAVMRAAFDAALGAVPWAPSLSLVH